MAIPRLADVLLACEAVALTPLAIAPLGAQAALTLEDLAWLFGIALLGLPTVVAPQAIGRKIRAAAALCVGFLLGAGLVQAIGWALATYVIRDFERGAGLWIPPLFPLVSEVPSPLGSIAAISRDDLRRVSVMSDGSCLAHLCMLRLGCRLFR